MQTQTIMCFPTLLENYCTNDYTILYKFWYDLMSIIITILNH